MSNFCCYAALEQRSPLMAFLLPEKLPLLSDEKSDGLKEHIFLVNGVCECIFKFALEEQYDPMED